MSAILVRNIISYYSMSC